MTLNANSKQQSTPTSYPGLLRNAPAVPRLQRISRHRNESPVLALDAMLSADLSTDSFALELSASAFNLAAQTASSEPITIAAGIDLSSFWGDVRLVASSDEDEDEDEEEDDEDEDEDDDLDEDEDEDLEDEDEEEDEDYDEDEDDEDEDDDEDLDEDEE